MVHLEHVTLSDVPNVCSVVLIYWFSQVGQFDKEASSYIVYSLKHVHLAYMIFNRSNTFSTGCKCLPCRGLIKELNK